MERDISQLRSTNKKLGESLGWIVDVLLQDETEAKDPSRLKKQKQEALESLSYVRDILKGNVVEIEDERLVGEEESLRRIQKSRESSNRPQDVVIPPPVPVSVVDTQQRRAASRRSHSPTQPQDLPTAGSLRRPPTLPLSPDALSNSGSRLPPWNYTRSAFSGLPSLPAEALPRFPPPSSTGSSGVSVRKARPEVQQDPLGVIR